MSPSLACYSSKKFWPWQEDHSGSNFGTFLSVQRITGDVEPADTWTVYDPRGAYFAESRARKQRGRSYGGWARNINSRANCGQVVLRANSTRTRLRRVSKCGQDIRLPNTRIFLLLPFAFVYESLGGGGRETVTHEIVLKIVNDRK